MKKTTSILSPIKLISSSLILLFVSGCASISKEECKTGDWNGIGFKDGSAGKKIARIQGYIEECGKHGATVDRAAYEKGRNEGLKTYCSKENNEASRTRRLLLTRAELNDLVGMIHKNGLTLVPMRVYIKGRRVKMEFGLGRGKKKADKREAIKKREWSRLRRNIETR